MPTLPPTLFLYFGQLKLTEVKPLAEDNRDLLFMIWPLFLNTHLFPLSKSILPYFLICLTPKCALKLSSSVTFFWKPL